MSRRLNLLLLSLLGPLLLLVMVAFILSGRSLQAQPPDDSVLEQDKIAAAEGAARQTPRQVEVRSGGLPITAPLFVGVDDVTVNTYLIDPVSGNAFAAFTGSEVWGAAYDPVNDLFYFTDGVELWQWPFGGVPSLRGNITVGGANATMVGLAFYNGTLYGGRTTGTEGIYAIDLSTYVATLVIDYIPASTATDIGGLAVDPLTGRFYGTNDDADLRGLVEIGPTGAITLVAAYEGGETDVDGLAIGTDGRAYLITDDNTPATFSVFDLGTMTYTNPIPSPWTSSEIFAGGAWRYSLGEPPTLSNVTATTPINENGTTTLSGDIGGPDEGSQALTLVVDWADGTVENFSYPDNATAFTETHQYLDDNPSGTPSDVYVISLTLSNNAGMDMATTPVTVNNVAPTANAGPDLGGVVGGPVQFSGGFTDPGTLDTHSFAWDFGDGGNGMGSNPSHVYNAAGVYTATLTVTDDDTGSGQDTVRVTVITPTDVGLSAFDGDGGRPASLTALLGLLAGGLLLFAWRRRRRAVSG